MRITPLVLLLLLAVSCKKSRLKDHPEWQQHFAAYGIENGCFMLRDQVHEVIHFYNKDGCLIQESPASTFKILSALIALETGVAPDEQMVIPWDSVERGVTAWNKDMNMREAFKVSNVPYFQEIARQIGPAAMKYYIDTVKYGNMQLSDNSDSFWLDGSLKISVDEQVGFLKRLYFNELKIFSERSQRIVRSMLLQEETPEYRLFYKTGWGNSDDRQILWITGYAERIQEVKEHKDAMNKSDVRIVPVFFAQRFEVPAGDTSQDWATVRIELLHRILSDFGAIP